MPRSKKSNAQGQALERLLEEQPEMDAIRKELMQLGRLVDSFADAGLAEFTAIADCLVVRRLRPESGPDETIEDLLSRAIHSAVSALDQNHREVAECALGMTYGGESVSRRRAAMVAEGGYSASTWDRSRHRAFDYITIYLTTGEMPDEDHPTPEPDSYVQTGQVGLSDDEIQIAELFEDAVRLHVYLAATFLAKRESVELDEAFELPLLNAFVLVASRAPLSVPDHVGESDFSREAACTAAKTLLDGICALGPLLVEDTDWYRDYGARYGKEINWMRLLADHGPEPGANVKAADALRRRWQDWYWTDAPLWPALSLSGHAAVVLAPALPWPAVAAIAKDNVDNAAEYMARISALIEPEIQTAFWNYQLLTLSHRATGLRIV